MTTVLSFDPSSVLEILIVAPDSCLKERRTKSNIRTTIQSYTHKKRNKHQRRKMCVTIIKSDRKDIAKQRGRRESNDRKCVRLMVKFTSQTKRQKSDYETEGQISKRDIRERERDNNKKTKMTVQEMSSKADGKKEVRMSSLYSISAKEVVVAFHDQIDDHHASNSLLPDLIDFCSSLSDDATYEFIGNTELRSGIWSPSDCRLIHLT